MEKYNGSQVVSDISDIMMYLDYNSRTLYDHVVNAKQKDSYILIRKYLTHSDLITKGKPTRTRLKKSSSVEDICRQYILYYNSVDELMSVEKYHTAAQSNISVPMSFYHFTSNKTYDQNSKKQQHISGNMFVPIDTLRNFSIGTFERIINYLGKKQYSKRYRNTLSSFKIDSFVSPRNGFLELDRITIAAHGLGTTDDVLLNFMRSMVFKGDVFNILMDLRNKESFFFFERNEKYFEILGKVEDREVSPDIWNGYQKSDKENVALLLSYFENHSHLLNGIDESIRIDAARQEKYKQVLESYQYEYSITVETLITSSVKPKYRWYQKKWREVLIKLDELAFSSSGKAICAISKLIGNYNRLGRFFIASHIKPYMTCIDERDYDSCFDPNNGLILSANIDALFDQHLISINVDNDGMIEVSEYVKIPQIDKIIPSRKLDKYYLTPKRMEYLRHHKGVFDRLNISHS